MGKVSTKLILSVILFLLTSLSTFAQDEQSNPSAQTDELSVVNALEKTSNDNVDENKPAQTVEELTNKLNDIIEFHGIPVHRLVLLDWFAPLGQKQMCLLVKTQ